MDDIGPTLELVYDLIRLEFATLQLDWRNPGRIVFFSNEQIVASLPVRRDVERAAIEIDDNTSGGCPFHRNAAPVLAAGLFATVTVRRDVIADR